MGISCFSCKREIGIFKARGSSKEIIRAGYVPPTSMSEQDRLCQECLNDIRSTQTQSKKPHGKINVGVQIILCIVFPLLAFWRIKRLTDFILFWLIMLGITLGMFVIAFLFYIEDNDSLMDLIIYFIGSAYLISGILPLYWIIKWTKEYNKNSV